MKAAGLCGLLFASAIPSQTFVVDTNNGPGTNDTTLTAAVPDGATRLVRAGSYAGFSIAQKGLTILGDPGGTLTDGIAFANTQPAQAIVLHRLTWPQLQPGPLPGCKLTCIGVRRCEG